MDDSAPSLASITVQVCHAPPPPQAPSMIVLQVAPGSTLGQVLADVALLERLGVSGGTMGKAGIWGKLRPPETLLRQDDRIELYRPLIADPKEARRRRAVKKVGEGRTGQSAVAPAR